MSSTVRTNGLTALYMHVQSSTSLTFLDMHCTFFSTISKSIESNRKLKLASLFASLQHKAADCCLHYFNISLGDWEQSMTFLFFFSYRKAEILIPWKYLSFWTCLYKFSLSSYKCCAVGPGTERSQSEQEEAGSPATGMPFLFSLT